MANKAKKVRTCKFCGHNNPDNASECNGCAKNIVNGFSSRYDLRWICPECGRYNMNANNKCLCGHEEGGCFISTAICQILGKSDDCTELQILRKFRDNTLTKDESLNLLVEEYYSISPPLANSLMQAPEKKIISESLFNNYLSKILTLIEGNRINEAVLCYKKMINYLASELGNGAPVRAIYQQGESA